MQPKIVEKQAFRVVGVQSHSPFETDDFGPVWKEYMAYHDAIRAHSTDGAHYGVCFGEKGAELYLAGMAVEGVKEVPEGLVLREVPGGRYAVFECTVQTIHNTYEHIFHEWRPASEHEIDESRAIFECYPPNTTSGESPVFIYVPVVS